MSIHAILCVERDSSYAHAHGRIKIAVFCPLQESLSLLFAEPKKVS
jgi:hypothetical protein